MAAMHAADALNRSVARWLKATDRCDSCGAQAYVACEIRTEYDDSTDLLFCSHHFGKHEAKLRRMSAEILDEHYLLELEESKRNR
jgi:hypothetical protein